MEWRVGGGRLEVDKTFSLDFVKNCEETNAILVHFFMHAKIRIILCWREQQPQDKNLGGRHKKALQMNIMHK